MTAIAARELVVIAGKRLLDAGLVSRTWGNVSCRIDAGHFAITPSGREYSSLTPEDIVTVALDNYSYEGSVKPSSEKGIHAEVYRLHPEAGFVIHTHQDWASAVSAAGIDTAAGYLCAGYGLPGTKTLRRNVSTALSRSGRRAVIMKHHGALCFGNDMDEAFRGALDLETDCRDFIAGEYLRQTGKSSFCLSEFGEHSFGLLSGSCAYGTAGSVAARYFSYRTAGGASLFDTQGGTAREVPGDDARGSSPEAYLHESVYSGCPSVNWIVHSLEPLTLSASAAGICVRPLLDDFAQIAGTSVPCVKPDAAAGVLRHASAVLLAGNGALCAGGSRGDAEAVVRIMEKNCRALASAALFGNIRYLSRFDSSLMRFVYRTKYSKLAGTR